MRMFVLPQVLGVGVGVELVETITLDFSHNNYIGTFQATFVPEGGAPFTLTGVPTGSRIPPA
jgi:hypothetical protein